jgi:hypothetical protein
MFKKLFVLLLIATCCLGCDKKKESVGCGTGACTLSFASITIRYTDKNGTGITVQNFTAINQRTKLSVVPSNPQTGVFIEPGYRIVTDDGMKGHFSADGDDVIVSATNPNTNQTKSVTLKISGGCNCHIDKLSGPQTVVFD